MTRPSSGPRAVRGLLLGLVLSGLNLLGAFLALLTLGGLGAWSSWQFIGFLAPGLTKKEKRLLFLSLPFVVLLFLLGVAYAFDGGVRLGAQIAHTSNAGLDEPNLGEEEIFVTPAWPF